MWLVLSIAVMLCSDKKVIQRNCYTRVNVSVGRQRILCGSHYRCNGHQPRETIMQVILSHRCDSVSQTCFCFTDMLLFHRYDSVSKKWLCFTDMLLCHRYESHIYDSVSQIWFSLTDIIVSHIWFCLTDLLLSHIYDSLSFIHITPSNQSPIT
jgi:hypothetical protein